MSVKPAIVVRSYTVNIPCPGGTRAMRVGLVMTAKRNKFTVERGILPASVVKWLATEDGKAAVERATLAAHNAAEMKEWAKLTGGEG